MWQEAGSGAGFVAVVLAVPGNVCLWCPTQLCSEAMSLPSGRAGLRARFTGMVAPLETWSLFMHLLGTGVRVQ